jgi:hypothetical protein
MLCCAVVWCHAAQGYRYEMYKFEKNGSRTEIARSDILPSQPVQTDVLVPGGAWFLDVSTANTQVHPYSIVPLLLMAFQGMCMFWLVLLAAHLQCNHVPNVAAVIVGSPCCAGLCWGSALLCCLA